MRRSTITCISARRHPPAAADSPSSDWNVDSAIAYYHERGRIKAIEPILNLSKDYGDGNTFSAEVVFDGLSGSTPNGALPSTQPRTFASPSGKSLSAAPTTYTTSSGQLVSESAPIYTINPGRLPMDPNYHDQRIAASGSWGHAFTRLLNGTAGGKLSYERDFDEKNTTLSFQVNDEFDSLSPIGGAPVAASDYASFEKTGGKTKDGGGNTTGCLYERRPDTRVRKSAYWENRAAWGRISADLSMRYMVDDWHVHSDTVQTHVRWWNFDRDRYLEPTVRWYRQSAADFYTPWLDSAAGGHIGYASADERLAAFHAVTYGLKYGVKLDGSDGQSSSEFSVRLEYYRQTPDNPRAGPGSLRGLDLYPGLEAILLQVGWRF